ncbi:ABC transporter ATP-binding protein [Actinobacteria bacterium YIM 96077]|uniref:ABC transporter ATP-binding protein n=1 Tax=Phytoactinopolyspora halophila TaxID=1981511 RepID=A0A329QJA4_9ACTN|nr:ABC transporter ATP-binding protein [Phytoactinopolyspora halophila]AYY12580.1 ABC transporter ATP-binding protein [Actinobacteria bacterium YIM 96077]RAW12517.1 ABC transporter ATP-binding protein [Phytoactinopolyspora halophila]
MITDAVIEFDGVGRTYPGPPPVHALQPTTLTVRKGEFVAVIGPSGSGKSTFLNITGLLDRPTAGTYRLDGMDVDTLGESERTALRGRRIGFVFQAFHLLSHRTAVENVMVPMAYAGVARRKRHRLALETLRHVGLGHRAQAMSNQLSGGERQRVAVARALVTRPSLLLCDEPTGNLDTTTAGSVLELLDGLHRDGQTVVVVTHNPDVAAHTQRRLLIQDGHVHETTQGALA